MTDFIAVFCSPENECFYCPYFAKCQREADRYCEEVKQKIEGQRKKSS